MSSQYSPLSDFDTHPAPQQTTSSLSDFDAADEQKPPAAAAATPTPSPAAPQQQTPTPQKSSVLERLRAIRAGTYRPGESHASALGPEYADTKPSELNVDPISGYPREKVLSTLGKAQAVAQGKATFDPDDEAIIRKHEEFERMKQGQLETANKVAVEPFERMSRAGAQTGRDLAERALVTPQTEIPMPDMPAPPLSQAEVQERLKGLPPAVVGTARATGSVAGGMVADPRMWPFFFAGPEVSPALRAATGAGFTAQMAQGAVEQAGELGKIMDNPDVPQEDKWEAGANAILSTLMAATGGAHLAKPALERLNEFQRLKPEDQQGIRAKLREKAPDVAAEVDKAAGVQNQKEARDLLADFDETPGSGPLSEFDQKSKTQEKIGYKLPRGATAAKVDGEVKGRNIATVTLDNGETWAFDKRRVNADAVKGYAERGEMWRLEGKKAPPEAEQQAKADLSAEPPAEATKEEAPAVTLDEENPQQEQQPDRRSDFATRKKVAEMTPEERARELLTSEKTGLPNRRAFDETEPAPAVAMSDADGLKALNDKFGYAAGDALLKAKAEALQEAGLDAYHEKGDEFLYRGESPDELKAKLDKARNILKNRVIEVETSDGKKLQFKGADFSYGTGQDLSTAEAGLKDHKSAREASGERARGELRGITEVRPQEREEHPRPAERASEEKPSHLNAQRREVNTAKENREYIPGAQITGSHGDHTRLLTPSGEHRVRYRVVEAADLQPSHNFRSFARNPRYPEGVQERVYDRSKEAQARVIQQAQNFEPGYVLNTNPDAVNGPPVTTPDGLVIGGNSRAMTMQRLYNSGRGRQYRKALLDQAHQFGLDRNDIQKMKQPVVVRELQEPPKNMEELRRLGSDLNKSMTGALGVSEKAVSAGKSVKPETLAAVSGMVNDLGEGATLRDVMRERGREIVKMMVADGVITDRERPQYIDTATGGLSEEGETFVERALLGAVVDDPALMESAPRSVLAKLEGSLGDLATVGSRTDEYNLLPLLREALTEHAEIARSGMSVDEYLRQQGMFGPESNPAVEAMVKALTLKPKEFRQAVREFAQDAKQDVEGQSRIAIGPEPSATEAFNHAFGAGLSDDQYADSLLQSLNKGRKIGIGDGDTGRKTATDQAATGSVQRDSSREARPSRAAGSKEAGRSDEENPAFSLEKPAPTFFSKAEKVAEEKLPKNVAAQSVISTLKNAGVKDEEIKWLGLDDWLKDKKVVTKQELLDFIRQNNVQVQEVEHQQPSREDFERAEEEFENAKTAWGEALQEFRSAARREGISPDEIDTFSRYARLSEGEFPNLDLLGDAWRVYENLEEAGKDWRDARDNYEAEINDYDPTKYSQYQLPGGHNYRELLLTLPEQGDESFQSSHFDEPNVLAHVRFNDRISPDGKKTLFIEEVQSDWHQKGRREGYQKKLEQASQAREDARKALATLIRSADNLGYDSTGDATGDIANGSLLPEHIDETGVPGLRDAAREYRRAAIAHHQAVLDKRGGVPDAPFKSTWHELAMKRMLRYAAENGYARIAWTTGEQQAARYDLSKQVKQIAVSRASDGKYHYSAIGLNGEEAVNKTVSAKELADHIGKDLAEKAVNSPKDYNVFSGVDLKVGGEGMKGFYDKILPDFMNKYGKKWGARVGETEILAHQPSEQSAARRDRLGLKMHKPGDYTPVHSIDITPSMRDSVLYEGQPLFNLSKDELRDWAKSAGSRIKVEEMGEQGGLFGGNEKMYRLSTSKQNSVAVTQAQLDDLSGSVPSLRRALGLNPKITQGAVWFEYDPPEADNLFSAGKPPTLTISREARDLINKTGGMRDRFNGANLSVQNARLIAARLAREAEPVEFGEIPEAQQAGATRLAEAIREAADDAGNKGVTLLLEGSPEHVAHEEHFHSMQRSFGEGSVTDHLPEEAVDRLLEHPAAKELGASLKEMGYSDDLPQAFKIAEIAAKVATAQHGIDDAKAADWFVKYVEELEQHHGKENVAHAFANLYDGAKKLYEQAKEARAVEPGHGAGEERIQTAVDRLPERSTGPPEKSGRGRTKKDSPGAAQGELDQPYLLSREKDRDGERGSSTATAMPIPALISSAAGIIGKGRNLYHGAVDKLLNFAHMGETRPEIRQYDPDAADLATKMDAAGQYHKAYAEMIARKVTGPLTEEFAKGDNYAERQKKNEISRDRMKGFHFLADKQNREWAEANHPEDYHRWASDPKIEEAIKAYKPFMEQLRDAVKQLGGKTIDEDYIKRAMDFAASGVVYEKGLDAGVHGPVEMKEGKSQMRGAGRDNVVSPQIDRSKARKDAGQYYWDHGVFDFGPSFEKRWVEVMSKLDEHRLAVHAMSMGTRIAPKEEAPDKIFYNGKEFYRPDIAQEIREVQKRGVSSESKALADALGVSELPTPGKVREYGFYEPLRKGSRFENAATNLARNVIAGEEDLKGQAANLTRMAQLKYAIPKEIVEALNDAGREKEQGAAAKLASKVLGPLTQFIRQQIVGLAYGVPHMANILRKVIQAHPGAALNPVAWADAFKVAFSKELKERAIKGVEDPVYDMLLRNAAISEGAIPEYKHYIEGNLDPRNWQEIGKTIGNAFRKGGRAEAKVTPGSAVAGVGRLAIEPLNRFSEAGHNNLFKAGGIDQRARLWLADFLKDRYPKMQDGRIAHEVNQTLGRYNRASWTDVQRGLAPFMLFPGWDYSSAAFALKHPFKTAIAPAVLMLLANAAVRSIGANRKDESKDTEGIHVGKYRVRTNLINDNMGSHIWGWALRGATAGLQHKGRKEVAGEMVRGLPGDVAGVTTGTMNPILSTPIQVAANRVAPGSSQEIIKKGDLGKKGKVLPNKGAEGLADFGARRLFPIYDRATQQGRKSSLASFAGLAGVNVSERKKKR